MNCNECINEIYLMDAGPGSTIPDDIAEHIATCDSCAATYSDIKSVWTLIKPGLSVAAPSGLKEAVLEKIGQSEKTKSSFRAKLIKLPIAAKRALAVAAMIAIIILIVPLLGKKGNSSDEAKAAANVFMNAIDATDSVQGMIMHFQIRTDEKDNFDYIGTNDEMVEHELIHSFAYPGKWILEKSGRTVLFDGFSQYLWIPSMKEAVKANANAEFIGWLHILLDPSSIYWKEKDEAGSKGEQLSMHKSGNDLLVTITSKAEGNFINDYMKNKTLLNSDNRREYVFDAKTYLLKNLKIYVLDNGKENLVFKIENINYNPTIDSEVFNITLPSGVDWYAFAAPVSNEALSAIDGKEAARLALVGLSRKDMDSNKDLWHQFNFLSRNLLLHSYGGLKILKIGEPFHSGTYAGLFVPYTIQLPNGSIKKWYLAVRNDNPNKVWNVDGGL